MKARLSLFLRNYIMIATLIAIFSLILPVLAQSQDRKPLYESFRAGKMEQAGSVFQELPESFKLSDAGLPLEQVLDNYEQLNELMAQARQKEYDQLSDDLEKSLKKAKWQDSLLAISKEHDFAADEKSKLEKQLADDSQKFWLEALADLFEIHSFCERMEFTSTVDPAVKAEIVERGLAIGTELEAAGKGLDAYSKALAFIGEITGEPNKYDQMQEELQRKAINEATYIPDPNSEGITWQERRKEITLEIIEKALAELQANYVEVPNFQQMLIEGIEYCMLLAQTDKIEQAFPVMADADKKGIYLLQLKTLQRKLRELPRESCDFNKCRQVITEIMQINSSTLELPTNVILAEFGEGLTQATDTYTHIVWPQAVEDFRKSMTNVFSGIGVVIDKNEEGYIIADSLISYDAPACKAGIDANDVIISVDGKETKDMTTERAIDFITGPDGTDVKLMVMRKGFNEPREFIVTRKQIVVPTVKGVTRDIMGDWEYFLDEEKTVGYLRLTSFSGETAGHLLSDIARLKAQGMKALVLDLRSNPGGYLETAVDIVNFFIKEGVIVSSRYRLADGYEDIRMARPSRCFDSEIPLVILVNSASASASEIVSGSLKDNGRALIVGTKTYGKGSVQNVIKLGFTDAELKLTIARYYLPGGRCVQRDTKDKLNKDFGVSPDVTVELTLEQLKAWAKATRDADTLHHPSTPREERNWDIWTVNELLEADPQLKTALLILKGQVLSSQQ
ncbi:MAG: S41 family peptidase [Sedimentisphaerales bacterium]|nr:S41 family peptidase [Sedimentisphaerales bacterium]MBN2843676.1 S41 family peptidase [Sedimentisphaerales bacterium]